MSNARVCPVCAARAARVLVEADEVAAELRARDEFFAARLDRSTPHRDVTDVVLGNPAAILRCARCGVLMRDGVPGDEVFRDDRYDHDELATLHDAHVRAFDTKESDYRPLLPPDAQVFEVGAYAGGFLAVAARWGWSARGTDIGRDAARFCQSRGLDVRCASFEECALAVASLDALFVWNCFEQIEDPAALLAEAHRVLREEGLLVLRVPDAAFYLEHRGDVEVLASNGFAGWPHRYGYDERNLRELVERHGFAFTRTLRRPAMRPLHEHKRRELDQGWIEMTWARRHA